MENLTLASCKVAARNDLYGSVRQTSLQCVTCQARPRPPRALGTLAIAVAVCLKLHWNGILRMMKQLTGPPVSPTYHQGRLTKKMRDYGIYELTKWRDGVWEAADDKKQAWYSPLKAFLPDNIINSVIKYIFSLTVANMHI